MRPRSVGTFLISRPETSAKLCARPRMRSMSSRERSSMEAGSLIVTPLTSACSADRDLVDAVDLLDAHVHALGARGGQVLADVVGPDRELAVAAVGQHGELHALRAPVVEQRLDRGAHGAAGVEHVVDQHDGHAVERELDVRVSARPAGARGRAWRRRRGRRRCRGRRAEPARRGAPRPLPAAGWRSRRPAGECPRWRCARRPSSRRSRERSARGYGGCPRDRVRPSRPLPVLPGLAGPG